MTLTPSNRFSCHCKDSGAECISGLRFSKDGLYLVSLSLNHTFTVWRAHTMEIMNRVWVFFDFSELRTHFIFSFSSYKRVV